MSARVAYAGSQAPAETRKFGAVDFNFFNRFISKGIRQTCLRYFRWAPIASGAPADQQRLVLYCSESAAEAIPFNWVHASDVRQLFDVREACQMVRPKLDSCRPGPHQRRGCVQD